MTELLLNLNTAIDADLSPQSAATVRSAMGRVADQLHTTTTISNEDWLLIPEDQRRGMILLWLAEMERVL